MKSETKKSVYKAMRQKAEMGLNKMKKMKKVDSEFREYLSKRLSQ